MPDRPHSRPRALFVRPSSGRSHAHCPSTHRVNALPTYGAFTFFFSSRRRHTRCLSDWSSDVCSSDLCAETVRQRSHKPHSFSTCVGLLEKLFRQSAFSCSVSDRCVCTRRSRDSAKAMTRFHSAGDRKSVV